MASKVLMIKWHSNFKRRINNNHGELLALFFAMKIAEQIQAKVICGDSNIAIQYWSKGQYNKEKISKNL